VLRSISISYPLPTRGAGMARAACLGCPAASLILVLTYLLAPLLYIGLAYVLLRWQGNYGPLARRWYNRQCMVWEGAAHPLPAAVPAEAVHWFMAPFVTFLPVSSRDPQGGDSACAQAWHFPQVLCRKHALLPARGSTELIRRRYSTRAKTCLLIQYLVVLKNTVGSNAIGLYSQSKHVHM
jgi:hypothetical protein